MDKFVNSVTQLCLCLLYAENFHPIEKGSSFLGPYVCGEYNKCTE